MTVPKGIDIAFLSAVEGCVGSDEELLFERRGMGDSTYELHGRVVFVDRDSGTVHIQRTRTSADEVHKMGLSYFLSVTRPSGVKLLNEVAIERNDAFRATQTAREAAVASAMANPNRPPSTKNQRLFFIGNRTGMLAEFPSERYVFTDLLGSKRKVGIVAKSHAAARKFMSLQDIFMPLDDMVWHAIDCRVLWPAWIEFSQQKSPRTWAYDWLRVYDALADIPMDILTRYFGMIRRRHVDSGVAIARDGKGVSLLVERGLVEAESPPQALVDRLARIPATGLRQLLKEAGLKNKYPSLSSLAETLLPLMTPSLEASVIQLMRKPRLRAKAPAGLTVDEFLCALEELRSSIFEMRQWVFATMEMYREAELAALVDVS